MRSRFTKLGVTIAALAALAVGGSAIATAAQKGGAPVPTVPTIAAQADTTQPGDDDTLQQGDQSSPDVAGAAEAPDSAAAETASESTGASDGPGGHADPAGNIDNQQQGEN